MQDFHGTALFEAEFVAASKRFSIDGAGDFDVTLGYGQGLIDGVFGGLRWTTPWSDRLRIVLEWDANDYPNDFHTRRTGVQVREGGLTTGVEYSWGWVNAQLSHQQGNWGAGLSLRVPLQQPTFVPKTAEPPLATIEAAPVASAAVWQDTPETMGPMLRALAAEGLSGVEIQIEGSQVRATFTSSRHSQVGRAAGRAARAIALHAPADVTSLELTFLEFQRPLVTWSFSDVPALRAYFLGQMGGSELGPTLSVAYADPDHPVEGATWADVFPGAYDGSLIVNRAPLRTGGLVTVLRNSPDTGVFRFQPVRVGTYFNDSVGAFKWDFYSVLEYAQWFGENTFINLAGRITLWENVSEVIIGSTSQLPRVRSDVGEYARNTSRLGLLHAYIGRMDQPSERVYTMVSAGYFEQMFAGIGGELLYLPATGNWAVDVRAFGVRQREFDGKLGFRDYDQITALAAFYYRFPNQGITLTARGGRFLAGDTGVRFEAKRRFLSNFEAGAWYTLTDANDICPWCTPNSPYRDKGVFIRFSMGAVLPRDSYAAADFSISPWTRDPGQMLRAPGNMYDFFERRLMLNQGTGGPWTGFGN